MAAKMTHSSSPSSGPYYALTLAWEENFDFPGSLKWFNDNWHIPYILGVLFYLSVLYFGQILMRNRDPVNVKLPMMIWNTGLAIFSILGFIRVFPEFVYSLGQHGFHHSICDNSYIGVKPARFWIYLFVLSKTPELCDTFFLVLRKQRLIFLHVYHHATVLIFSWFVYSNSLAAARWFCTMNFGVHSIMYSYYVLKAVPNLIRIPKWVSMLITASQTVQMIFGAYVVASSYHAKLSGRECATTTTMSISGLIIYISYLFLFSQFFYRAYCSPPPPRDGSGRQITDKKRA